MAARDPDPGAPRALPAAGLHLSLEHAGDPEFQRREWRVQRGGWALLGIFVTGAAFGVFGPGPCSEARTAAPDASLAVAFERVVHQDAPTRWRIGLHGPLRELSVGGDAPHVLEIDDAPRRFAAGRMRGDELVLALDAEGPGTVEIQVVPRRVGLARTRLRADGGQALVFTQLVLP